jgi:voltage-gated potassium channel Kch
MQSNTSASGRVLVLGDAQPLQHALARRLATLGVSARTVEGHSDAELTRLLQEDDWTAVAVLTHEDALALRLTLLCAHVRPELALWVTLFDRTILHQLHEVAPSVNVVATADLVAAEMTALCQPYVADSPRGLRSGLRLVDDALRLMVIAGLGLFATLVIQTLLNMIELHDGLISGIYYAAESEAAVTGTPHGDNAADWVKVISTIATIVAVGLIAVFTAALVRRLSRPRLTTIFGRRRVPARGHALVIGFGQIGFRLTQELQALGIPVVALEQNVDAPCVRLARRAGIPIAIGRGDDRAVLELLGVGSCAVVAAVTSDDLANVAIGLAATDVRTRVPLIMRLGDGDVAKETESLLHLGEICDAHALIATALADAIIRGGGRPLSGESCLVSAGGIRTSQRR